MKKKSLICFFVLSLFGAKAQQVGTFSHYFYKPLVYNPAFAGNGETNAMIIHHAQWNDFKYAPQLNLFTIDGAIKEKKVGLGLAVISDRKGITKRTGINLSYAYRVHFNEDATLSFGLSAGIVDQTIDFSRVTAENYADPTLFYNSQHKAVFDANAGIAFTWKGLEAGFAVPQVMGNKINYNEDTSGVRNFYRQSRHMIGSVKYKIPVSADKGISIAPMALLRIVPNAPLQYDGNLNFEWKDKFWIGATYKSSYAIGANVGVCLHKQLYVGYSYDIITGKIGTYSGLSHEIMVNYKFGKGASAPLSAQPDHTDPVAEHKPAENPAYEGKLDSLRDQLSESERKISENERKINELYAKIDQLGKAQAQQQSMPAANNTASNPSATEPSIPPKGFNDGKDMISNAKTEYVDTKDIIAPKGYYIIVGTFFYRDFAEAEAQRFVKRGYKSTGIVYSKIKKHNFIHVYKLADQQEANTKLNEIRAAGYKEAWILELTDQ